MPGSIPAVRRHLIDAIAAQVRRDRRTTPVPALGFVRDYFRGVDEDDLREHAAASLAAAAVDHLRFGARRRPGQPLVRVFNPTHDEHGWSAGHSVVEVVTDDMPFLVDSLAMVLNDCGISLSMMVHPVLYAQRDRTGRLTHCGSEPGEGARAESWQHVAIDRVEDPVRREDVRRRILATLDDVDLAVRDWPRMRARAAELAGTVGGGLPGIGRAECAEAGAFLAWLADNHFTFLGYREYRLLRGAATDRLAPVAGSGLGLMRTGKGRPRPQTALLRGEARRRAREATALVVPHGRASLQRAVAELDRDKQETGPAGERTDRTEQSGAAVPLASKEQGKHWNTATPRRHSARPGRVPTLPSHCRATFSRETSAPASPAPPSSPPAGRPTAASRRSTSRRS